MADIFISYASADRDQVGPLAEALADRGWSVWWDRQIPPGKTFDEVIEAALDQARVVLAVWTEAGVASPWVRTEAAEGAARGILVPVAMEEVRIPLAFRRIQAADLIAWEPGQETTGFIELIDALDELIGEPQSAEPEHVDAADPVEDAVRAAQEKAATGDWEGSVRLLVSIEDETPRFADAYPHAAELLARLRRKRDAVELYEDAEVLYADGRWHDVVARFDRILELDPEIEYGTDLKSRAERHIEDEHKQRLERSYQRATEALKAHEWPLAIARFEELLAESPDYQDATAQLEAARAGAAAERRYRSLQEAFSREGWGHVIAGMAELTEANPDFGDPHDLLDRARARLAEQERAAAGDDIDSPTSADEQVARETSTAPTEESTTLPEVAAPTPSTPEWLVVEESDKNRHRLDRVRSRAPTWSLGLLVIFSAYLPWFNPPGPGMFNSPNIPLSYLVDHDFQGLGSELPIMLAVPILTLGLVIAVTGGRRDRTRLRRAAGSLVVLIVGLFAIASFLGTDNASELFRSLGPYLALVAGVVSALPDPLLVNTRDAAAERVTSRESKPVLLALAISGALVVLVGLFQPWTSPGQTSFELNAGGPFGIGHVHHRAEWFPSIGVLIPVVLAASYVATRSRHHDLARGLPSIAVVILWIVAGYWLAVGGRSLVIFRSAIEYANDSVNSGFWIALTGAIIMLTAVPLSRAVGRRAAHSKNSGSS